jgi:hypothetical protein
LHIPYDYIADQKLKTMTDLRSKYDVILFGPVGGNAQSIVNGRSTVGEPIPFKASTITPNLGGAPDTTDDMRPGMGLEGIFALHKFVEEGGLFITITGNATIPIDYGFVEGVSVQAPVALRAQGSVLNAVFADKNSPIAYGYGDGLAVYFSSAPILNVGGGGGFGGRGGGGRGGGSGRGGAADTGPNRPSGRGTMTDPDTPQGRPLFVPPTGAAVEGGGPDDDANAGGGGRGGRGGGNPAAAPRVILRFAAESDLLVSGMMTGGSELAGKAAVIDCQKGKGHVLIFANNPMWRSETHGSYFLLFNAMLNFQHLDAGKPAPRGPAVGAAQ